MPPGLRIFDLTGKTALVTGACQGVGTPLAQGLAAAGATVVLNGVDRAQLDDATKGLKGQAYAGTLSQCDFDVSDHTAARKSVDQITAKLGAIDILVNAASLQHQAPLAEFPPDRFEDMLKVNVSSIFNVSQAAARHMIRRGHGKVINIASVQTAVAQRDIAPDTAMMGAVANLTKGMATDWARHGLQINAIAPGYLKTRQNQALADDVDFTAWLERRTPAGRWGSVDELIGACIFLASAASNFVNGHVLYVDGGVTACL